MKPQSNTKNHTSINYNRRGNVGKTIMPNAMRGANVMFQWHGRKDHEFPGGQKLTQKWKIFNKILMKIDNKNFFPADCLAMRRRIGM